MPQPPQTKFKDIARRLRRSRPASSKRWLGGPPATKSVGRGYGRLVDGGPAGVQLRNMLRDPRWYRFLMSLSVGWPLIAWGQDVPYTGARLRVFVNRGTQVAVGSLAGSDRDSLTLSVRGGETARLGWSEISRVEQSMGVHRHTLAGAAIGFGAGAVMGAAYGSGIKSWDISATNGAIYLGIALGVGGGLLGAIAGDVIRTEGWRPIAVWRTTTRSEVLLGLQIVLPALR